MLKLSGSNERDIQLTKRQHVQTTTFTTATAITTTPTVSATTTKAKGMKVRILENIEGSLN